jgi:hypothetical protein
LLCNQKVQDASIHKHIHHPTSLLVACLPKKKNHFICLEKQVVGENILQILQGLTLKKLACQPCNQNKYWTLTGVSELGCHVLCWSQNLTLSKMVFVGLLYMTHQNLTTIRCFTLTLLCWPNEGLLDTIFIHCVQQFF